MDNEGKTKAIRDIYDEAYEKGKSMSISVIKGFRLLWHYLKHQQEKFASLKSTGISDKIVLQCHQTTRKS